MLNYFVKEALHSFKSKSVLTITALSVILFFLSLFILISLNANLLILGLIKNSNLIVYLEDELKIEEIVELKKKIGRFREVAQVIYTSEEEALEKLKKDLGGEKDILEGIEDNPLPASLEVKLRQEEILFNWQESRATLLAGKIQGLKGVTEVDYGERVVKIFGEAIRIVKIIFTAIGLVLILGILVIMFSTIRLTLLSRENEIEIMKLVGATNWFIRWPFLIEGMLKILLGQGLALLFLFLLYKFIDFKLVTTFAFFSFSFIFLPLAFIAGLILFSLFLGFTGSLISCYHFSTRSEE